MIKKTKTKKNPLSEGERSLRGRGDNSQNKGGHGMLVSWKGRQQSEQGRARDAGLVEGETTVRTRAGTGCWSRGRGDNSQNKGGHGMLVSWKGRSKGQRQGEMKGTAVCKGQRQDETEGAVVCKGQRQGEMEGTAVCKGQRQGTMEGMAV